MLWILFAFLTVFSWGVYGVYLHKGQTQMEDMINGRWKAFLFVGFAYFLVAVIGPLVMLRMNGASTNFFGYPGGGKMWSLIAGIVGAIGAFGVLLAFGYAPKPTQAYVPVIMSIIFAGAPIVNAFASIYYSHAAKDTHYEYKPAFWIGLVLAAVGGSLVARFKPEPVKNAPPPLATPATPPSAGGGPVAAVKH